MYLFKRGNVWWFKFQMDGELVRASTKTSNRRAAENIAAKRRLELVQGEIGIEDLKLQKKEDALRFPEAVDYFLNWLKINREPKTVERNATAAKALLRHFKKKPIDKITAEECEAFKATRMIDRKRIQGATPKDGRTKTAHKPVTGTVGAVTINAELTCLKHMFKLLVANKKLKSNPAQGVKFLKIKKRGYRVLTFEEEREYLFACTDTLRDFATVMLETGMRPVEVRNLRIEDVHLDAEEPWLHVHKSKTESGIRDLFCLSDRVVAILKRRIAKSENGILFPETRGHVDNHHRDVLDRLPHIAKFRIYDLRHTFATRQVEYGTDLVTLSAMLGHANIKETMRYAHPSDEHKANAMRRMHEERSKWERQQTRKTA